MSTTTTTTTTTTHDDSARDRHHVSWQGVLGHHGTCVMFLDHESHRTPRTLRCKRRTLTHIITIDKHVLAANMSHNNNTHVALERVHLRRIRAEKQLVQRLIVHTHAIEQRLFRHSVIALSQHTPATTTSIKSSSSSSTPVHGNDIGLLFNPGASPETAPQLNATTCMHARTRTRTHTAERCC
jgi:hypothetical protein